MKIVTNHKLIKRRRLAGQILTIASLVVLAGGLIMSFQLEKRPDLINYSFLALILGFILSQIGIYFGNRWGRSPRPDERLVAALKGLGGQYTLYNYTTVVPHLLVGPAGIWVLLPYNQTGTITFDEKKRRWNQKGGNWYLKLFAQESLGRPDLDVANSLTDFQRWLNKNLSDIPLPEPKAVLVFTNNKVNVQVGDPPVPTLPVDKLKDFIRRTAKSEQAPLESIKILQKALPDEQPEETK